MVGLLSVGGVRKRPALRDDANETSVHSLEAQRRRFWTSHSRLGFLTLTAEAAFVLAYFIATPDGPHRIALLAVSSLTLVAAVVTLAFLDRVSTHPWRVSFSLASTLAAGAALTLCIYLGRGARQSPGRVVGPPGHERRAGPSGQGSDHLWRRRIRRVRCGGLHRLASGVDDERRRRALRPPDRDGDAERRLRRLPHTPRGRRRPSGPRAPAQGAHGLPHRMPEPRGLLRPSGDRDRPCDASP